MNAIARLLGIKSTDEIDHIEMKFAAWWSEGRPVLVLLVCLGLAALGAFFYYRYQNEQPLEKKKRRRILLTVSVADYWPSLASFWQSQLYPFR